MSKSDKMLKDLMALCPELVLRILSFLFFFEDYESEGLLVKSSIQFEFDEQILQVSLVPNSSSRVMVVTTNGLYVYSCEGKRKKLIMTNRTTLSKVPPFTENYGHGISYQNQMDVWKVLLQEGSIPSVVTSHS